MIRKLIRASVGPAVLMCIGAVIGSVFVRLAGAAGLPGWVGYALMVGGLVILVLYVVMWSFICGNVTKEGGGFENLQG